MLEVVLDDPIGEIGLTEVASGFGGLQLQIGDLQPPNRREVVKTDVPCPNLNVCRKRQDMVAPTLATRYADIPYYTGHSPPGDQYPEAFLPNGIELIEELVVVGHVA